MKHRIVIRCEAHSLSDFALKQQIAKCITAALDKQGVDTPCEIIPLSFSLAAVVPRR